MDLREVGLGGVDWTDLAQERGRWRALVNTVINLRVTRVRGISSVAEDVLASQEGLCFMELVVDISK